EPSLRFASALDMALAIEQCMHIASAHEIGEWVQATASGVLAERAQKIAEIESRPSEDVATSLPLAEAPRPAVEPAASHVATQLERAVVPPSEVATADLPAKEEATDNNPGTPLTQISNAQSVDVEVEPAPRSSRWRVATGLAVIVACAAAAVFVVRRSR